jgi:hypothetical protein
MSAAMCDRLPPLESLKAMLIVALETRNEIICKSDRLLEKPG